MAPSPVRFTRFFRLQLTGSRFSSTAGFLLFTGRFPAPAWFFLQQVSHEKVLSPSLAVGALADPVAASRKDDHLKVPVRLDQGIDHLHGGGRIHVAIQFANGQQQLPILLSWQPQSATATWYDSGCASMALRALWPPADPP